MYEDMTWLNPPARSESDAGTLTVTTGAETDLWRHTFYGFVHDDAHFLHEEVTGDFTAQVTLSGDYRELYDQCGLMVRVDEENWSKAGVELTDGTLHLSSVLTRGHSDRSMVPLPGDRTACTLRVTRHGEALRVQVLDERGGWAMTRLGHLDMPAAVQVGLMCCSPQRAGFVATFEDYRVGPAVDRALHA